MTTASLARGGAYNPARFAALFGACFLLGFGVLLLPPAQAADRWFSAALVKIAQGAIAICGGHASREGAILRAPSGFGVEMKDGCNAANVTILLWAAILAFPAPWRKRAAGLAAGAAVIQCVNIVRFISLFYLGQYSERWFEFAHAYLWESLLALDTMVVFWVWAQRVRTAAGVSHARA